MTGLYLCLPVPAHMLYLHSDLDKPLPRWRRRVVEISSESCSRIILFIMGFWRPRLIGYENYKKGQEMGEVGLSCPE